MYDITATDAEGDVLVITATTKPTWATFVDGGDGTAQVTGTPPTTSSLGFQFVISVSDGMFEDIQDFRVQVTANNIVDFGYGTVNVYPNPSAGMINIINCQGSQFEIHDVTGRILMAGKINNSSEQINIEEFATGNLFIRFYDNEKVYTVKIVKI